MSNEMWLFVGTMVVGLLFMLFGYRLLQALDRVTLRGGLWINGLDRAERDRVMDWYEGRHER